MTFDEILNELHDRSIWVDKEDWDWTYSASLNFAWGAVEGLITLTPEAEQMILEAWEALKDTLPEA